MRRGAEDTCRIIDRSTLVARSIPRPCGSVPRKSVVSKKPAGADYQSPQPHSTITHTPSRKVRQLAGLLFTSFAVATSASAAVEETVIPESGFGAIDWLVVIIYALVLIGIGLYYARRQTTTEEYFVGGRTVSPFLVGISLYATLFSTLSYIGVPGEIIQNGPILIALGAAAAPLIYIIVGYGVIPMLMKLPVTSAYELLETRLGFRVRLLGSALFVITRLLWMAIMLHITSFVLVKIMGWDPAMVTPLAIIAGVLTAIYTVTGGIRAVVVSDVVQFFVLLTGAIFTLIFITISMGGVDAWWPTEWASHWQAQPFFSVDPDVRITMVGTFIGAIIWWVCTSASDQMAIQRYLSTRDAKSARHAFLHNTIGSIVVTTILCFVGFSVLAFYQANPGAIPADITLETKGDVFFPLYVSQFLPTGIPGLVLAGLLAAAMSSLSSGINSTVTVISKDFIDPFRKEAHTDAHQVKVVRYIAAGIGLAAIAGSQLAGIIPGNLIEVGGKTINLLVCPLFGLFFLALFVKFATPFGAIMGAIYSITGATLIGYWEVLIGGDPVSFQWIAPVSLLITVICGPLFSLLPTRGKPKPVLAAYTIASLVPLIAFITLAH